MLFILLTAENGTIAQQSAIKILPPLQTVGVDSSGSIKIKLEDVTDLHAYSIEVSYDPALLKYQSLTRLNFLSGWQTFYFPFIDTVNGKIRVDEAILGPFAQSGSGEIFSIFFKGLNEGNCHLTITSGELRDLTNQSIPVIVSNGMIQVRLIVGILYEEVQTNTKTLIEVFPNPFNSSTNIVINSDMVDEIVVKIININGEEVFSEYVNSKNGKRTFRWDGKDKSGNLLPSGVYLIVAQNFRDTMYKKIMLLK